MNLILLIFYHCFFLSMTDSVYHEAETNFSLYLNQSTDSVLLKTMTVNDYKKMVFDFKQKLKRDEKLNFELLSKEVKCKERLS